MVITGGRTNANNSGYDQNNLPIEIYDTESSEWQKIGCANRYRHSSVISESNQLLIYGGFEPDLPNKPLDSLLRFELAKLFQNLGGMPKQLHSS